MGSDNTLVFGSYGVGEIHSTGTIANDGLFHYVTVSFVDSANTIRLYIDGVLSGTGTLNLPVDVASHLIRIGSNPAGAYFRGQMDEFRVFNRALSQSEIQSIMSNAIVPGATPTPTPALTPTPTPASTPTPTPAFTPTPASTPTPAPAPPNQVTALAFSEGSGTTTIDSSGAGHNGTLVNGPTWTAGKYGNGLSLDGTNDHVVVANPSTLNFGTADFTLAVWLKRTASGSEYTIFSKTASASWTNGGKEFFIDGGSNRLGFGAYGVNELFSTGVITNDGLWHHVTVTFVDSTNTLTFYIDGVASGSGTLNLPADVASHVVKVGGHPAGHYFQGQMDEFRVFSRPPFGWRGAQRDE